MLAAVLIVVQLIVARSITGPIRRAITVIQELAKGNLAMEVRAEGKDETGQMLASLGGMVAKVRAMISNVKEAAEPAPLRRQPRPRSRPRWKEAPPEPGLPGPDPGQRERAAAPSHDNDRRPGIVTP